MLKKQEKKEVKEVKTPEFPVLEKGEDLKSLVEKNIKWSQVIYEQNQKIKRRMTMMVILGYLRLLVIVVPLVLALIYLPPMFKEMWGQYSSLLGVGAGSEQISEIMSQISSGQLQEIISGLGN